MSNVPDMDFEDPETAYMNDRWLDIQGLQHKLCNFNWGPEDSPVDEVTLSKWTPRFGGGFAETEEPVANDVDDSSLFPESSSVWSLDEQDEAIFWADSPLPPTPELDLEDQGDMYSQDEMCEASSVDFLSSMRSTPATEGPTPSETCEWPMETKQPSSPLTSMSRSITPPLQNLKEKNTALTPSLIVLPSRERESSVSAAKTAAQEIFEALSRIKEQAIDFEVREEARAPPFLALSKVWPMDASWTEKIHRALNTDEVWTGATRSICDPSSDLGPQYTIEDRDRMARECRVVANFIMSTATVACSTGKRSLYYRNHTADVAWDTVLGTLESQHLQVPLVRTDHSRCNTVRKQTIKCRSSHCVVPMVYDASHRPPFTMGRCLSCISTFGPFCSAEGKVPRNHNVGSWRPSALKCKRMDDMYSTNAVRPLARCPTKRHLQRHVIYT